MKLGIIGLPNVGKSTVFNALTKAGAEASNYPFTTIEPNVGIVAVPDPRLDFLAKLYKPQKVTYATIEFVDIAGLVKGAGRGEGLGNKFLSHIRQVDALIHVVRCFDNPGVMHVNGEIEPVRDVETIIYELIFADMESLEKLIDKTSKLLKGDKKYEPELAFYERLHRSLEKGIPARQFEYGDDERKYYDDLFLLTVKPVLYIANIPEKDVPNPDLNVYFKSLKILAEREGSGLLPICAKIEEEIAALGDDEREFFQNELGLDRSGLDRLIFESYRLLGLISFMTVNNKEVRAWTISRGLRAPQAAGKVHTDFEKGFIRADIVAFDDLERSGTYAAARERALVRSEGREYVMRDGDVALFRFNI